MFLLYHTISFYALTKALFYAIIIWFFKRRCKTWMNSKSGSMERKCSFPAGKQPTKILSQIRSKSSISKRAARSNSAPTAGSAPGANASWTNLSILKKQTQHFLSAGQFFLREDFYCPKVVKLPVKLDLLSE